MNRALSAGWCAYMVPGALPQARMKAVPLALHCRRCCSWTWSSGHSRQRRCFNPQPGATRQKY
jgi:hypothetical protein